MLGEKVKVSRSRFLELRGMARPPEGVEGGKGRKQVKPEKRVEK